MTVSSFDLGFSHTANAEHFNEMVGRLKDPPLCASASILTGNTSGVSEVNVVQAIARSQKAS